MNLKELKEIFRLVEKTNFKRVEIVRGDVRVCVEKDVSASDVVTVPLDRSGAHVGSAGVSSPVAVETPDRVQPGLEVTSPFVGTFYRASSPGAQPFIELHQAVKKGQTIGIVEAMKLMNEIEAECDGKIIGIYPENGQPVEFGEKLFRIDPLA